MRAAILARISEDRAGLAAGVDRQLQDGRALTAQRGWTAAGEYPDNDLSALRAGPRPQYEAMMAAVARGEIDVIVVYHLSRLWRNRSERAEGIEILRQARVSVVAVKGPELDMTSATGRAMTGLLGEFDTMESELKGERVSRAAQQRAENGGNSGGPRPYGYGLQVGVDENGKPILDYLRLVPTEADEIIGMYRQFLAGVPLGSIVRDLNTREVPTARDAKWASHSIRSIMRRARNAGFAVYKGEIVGVGKWETIVDQETWKRAVTLLEDPSRRSSTGNRASYLLSGIALCGVCGVPVMSGGKKKRPGVYTRIYRCRAATHVGRRADWVDEFVTGKIIARLSRPDAIDLLIDDDRPDFDALRTKAMDLRSRLEDLAAAFAAGEINRQQLRVGSEKLNEQLDVVEKQQQHSSRAPILRELVGVADVAARWHDPAFGLDRQRAVVQALVTVTLLPGGGGQRTFDPTKVIVEPKG